ncbi:MAG: membrane protein insertase YidC [Holosporales bacterium]|nr:membrane protein insertase YidC [Holosporales bacterium]
MDENKNLIIAMTLSFLIFLGWQHFFAPESEKIVQQDTAHNTTAHASTQRASHVPLMLEPAHKKAVVSPSPRLEINAPELQGSLALRGGCIDDIFLKNFRQCVNPDSAPVRLLSDYSHERPFFITLGWHLQEGAMPFPEEDTVWAVSAPKLEHDKPVTLTWQNGQGVTFERVLTVDKNFLLAVKQRIINNSPIALKVRPFAMIEGIPSADIKGQWTFHEGAVGFLNDRLEEKSFETIHKEGTFTFSSNGGWAGITEKYWLVAFLAEHGKQQETIYRYVPEEQHYRVETQGADVMVPQGGVSESAYHFYIGAKNVQLLDGYEEQLGVKHFDLAIDFGYLYFLTRPLFYTLVYMKDLLGGNMGGCIILLTILIKLLLFPLANRSYRAMSRMKKLQPKVQELQKRYQDDKPRMSQELMALYKREKANPVGGCLPQLIQFPVLFALYKVFLVSIEMRHASLWWIKDLSAPDPFWITNLFGIIPWTPFEFLQIGIWPLLMGATMFIQQKMSPPPADPAQAKMFLIMPFMFTFMLAQLPAGLVMYWTWSNILSILQQWMITKMDERRRAQEAARHT